MHLTRFKINLPIQWQNENTFILDKSSEQRLRTNGPSNVQFAADVVLGSLAKWLRILGFDTFYSNNIDDNQLLETAWREKRILLSKDHQLIYGVNPKQALLIESKKMPQQLRQVVTAFHLNHFVALFSRCVDCNVQVVPIEKAAIKEKVPAFVYQNYDEFWVCPECRQVFWPGTHKEYAGKWLAENGILI